MIFIVLEVECHVDEVQSVRIAEQRSTSAGTDISNTVYGSL